MRIEEALQTSKFIDGQHKATLNLLYTSYWLKTLFSNAMKEHAITMEQFNVMRILKGKHPEQMCVKDIAGRMIEKSSNVPRILDKLLLKKLVKRTTSKSDKRETLISLTDKGMKLLNEANASLAAVSEQFIGINESEAGQLNDLLEKMRKADLPE